MKSIYIINIIDNYALDVVEELSKRGVAVRGVGSTSRYEIYPRLLQFCSDIGAEIIELDSYNFSMETQKTKDFDFGFFSIDFMEEMAEYEKLFMLTIDRNSFNPMSYIRKYRLYYRMLADAYAILEKHNPDMVFCFGMPHGLLSILLFGVAKKTGRKVLYSDWVANYPNFSILEDDILIRRSPVNEDSVHNESQIKSSFLDEIHQPINIRGAKWNTESQRSLLMRSLYDTFGLIIRNPFKKIDRPEFFLDSVRRMRFFYFFQTLNFYIKQWGFLRYYLKNSVTEVRSEDDVIFFLHYQPEATSVPQSGIFSDQLLMLEIIINSVSEDTIIYVKEHPGSFSMSAQSKHDRDMDFYEYIINKKNVQLLSPTVNTDVLIKKSRNIVSGNGSVGWEALQNGSPCIIFGWAWYGKCDSCFSVDSVETLVRALDLAKKKSTKEVFNDVTTFNQMVSQKIVDAPAYGFCIDHGTHSDEYSVLVSRLARAIELKLFSNTH